MFVTYLSLFFVGVIILVTLFLAYKTYTYITKYDVDYEYFVENGVEKVKPKQ